MRTIQHTITHCGINDGDDVKICYSKDTADRENIKRRYLVKDQRVDYVGLTLTQRRYYKACPFIHYSCSFNTSLEEIVDEFSIKSTTRINSKKK